MKPIQLQSISLVKRGLAALSAILLCSSLSGCQKVTTLDASSLPASSSSLSSAAQNSSESEEAQPQGNFNPLTGKYDLADDMVNTRPVAVMINNHHSAWPQMSLSDADIVYELPVEGGFTRLMALYSDYREIKSFGSIRSARHDFVELALPWNPVFIHWGGSDFGYQTIRNTGIDHIDGMTYGETYFYTDYNLGRSIEHCRFTDPQRLSSAMENLGFMLQKETPSAYQFHQEAAPLSFSQPAMDVTIPFSGDITVRYEYLPQTGQYQKYEYGEVTKDGNTNEPVLIDNVFILFTSVSIMEDGEHKDIGLSGGNGFYLTQGSYTPIQWSKGDAASPLRYSNPDGTELTVNPGNSWVFFMSSSLESRVNFGGAAE